VAGVVTLFCLWWIYFDHEQNPRLNTARRSFMWGYGHYFVFASAAAVGAGLVVAVAFEREETDGISSVVSSLATTVPVAIYLIAVCLLHAHPGRRRIIPWSFGVAAVLVLADSIIPAPLYVTAGVLAVLVVVLTVSTRTHSAKGSPDDRADQLGG
ncbi:MAG: low temperature requirement protein A, partial [Nakamurella sp.]